MSWSARQARQQAAVVAALGHDASWTGVDDPVRVVLRDEDVALGMTVSDRVIIRVRKSEVPAPTEGDTVALTEDGRVFEVIAAPLLDRKLNWNCEAAPVAT